jgi:hypothetical protein
MLVQVAGTEVNIPDELAGQCALLERVRADSERGPVPLHVDLAAFNTWLAGAAQAGELDDVVGALRVSTLQGLERSVSRA